MAVKDFFNLIYKGNLDTDAIIGAVQPELDAQSKAILDNFYDTFPIMATETGLLKWENILDIVSDTATESLEFRRGRIINRLSSNIPYTERTLRIIMDTIMGEGNWSYNLDYRNYKLDILSLRPGRDWFAEMFETLKKMVPANILWTLYTYYVIWQVVYETYDTWGDVAGVATQSHDDLSVYAHAELAQKTHAELRTSTIITKTWQEVMEGM